MVNSNRATTVQSAPAKRGCPFKCGKRACEGSLIAESRPKSHLCQTQFGFAKQILRRVDSKLDEPLMNRSAKALSKATREVTGGEMTGGCKVRNSDLAFKMPTQHLLGANLLPDLQARLCSENSLTVSIVLEKMRAHKKRDIF